MRNIVNTSILLVSVLAASASSASNVRAEPMNGAVTRTLDGGGDKGGWIPRNAERGERRMHGGGGGGWGGIAGFLGGLEISSAFMEDSGAHYRRDCLYIGDCKVTFTSDPNEPPIPPKVEKRKKGPRPIRHVTDKRTGWTYYLSADRNDGQTFIQIVDANGNDVHVDGSIPMPGGGPMFPVR
jgi:hypothetical protein